MLPRFTRDTTDRNRTSPFAFTGNKFEFRMLGSSNSIACANIMLNTAVAEILRQFADELEGADDFEAACHALIRRTIKEHKRIIFNGNGYDDAWIKEATEVRGLLNLRTTPDALATLLDEKNVAVLTEHKVMTESEIHSRYEINMDNYVKTVRIEAITMADMARRQILPAVEQYVTDLSAGIAARRAADSSLACTHELKQLSKLSALSDQIDEAAEALESAVAKLDMLSDVTEQAFFIRDVVIADMAALRAPCDEAETLTPAARWPFPTYGDLLFSVK